MSAAVFGSIIASVVLLAAILMPRSDYGRAVLGFVHKYIL